MNAARNAGRTTPAAGSSFTLFTAAAFALFGLVCMFVAVGSHLSTRWPFVEGHVLESGVRRAETSGGGW
jgi:hypothetical protein